MTRLTLPASLVAGVLIGATPAAQQAVFRATTTSVTVDVTVHQGGRVVSDLEATDFEVYDNGLPQQVTAVTRETLPIDVTCVVDLSGSVQGPVLEALTRAIDDIGTRLGPTDRAAVVTFNQQIRLVRPLEAGGWPAGFSLPQPASLTSLFDALTVALIAAPEPGRRRMAIVFTDGLDTTSFLDGAAALDVARRAGTAVFAVALAEGTVRRPQRPAHEQLLRTLAETTGGTLSVLQQDEDLGPSFIEAFEAFRTSYVLTYTYDGPPQSGWHPIDVRVTRPGSYEVRAGQGYFGGE